MPELEYAVELELRLMHRQLSGYWDACEGLDRNEMVEIAGEEVVARDEMFSNAFEKLETNALKWHYRQYHQEEMFPTSLYPDMDPDTGLRPMDDIF